MRTHFDLKAIFSALLFVFVPVTGFVTTAQQHASTGIDLQQAVSVNQVLTSAPASVGKEIIVKGVVTHVCKHGGRRCFVADSAGQVALRVEAGGKITGFNRELDGRQVVVRGTLMERRIDAAAIREMEARAAERNQTGHCSAEIRNINKMKEWMARNNKQFYSIYFVQGADYEVVD